MLSILIPVYQFDVRKMVQELLRQGRELDIPFEIRVYDDASPGTIHHANRELDRFTEVHYCELEHNLGRARIRNLLAREAQFRYLLFLDGDSTIIRSDFLRSYLGPADETTVLHGGTAYAPTPPEKSEQFLRWWYGQQREVRSPEERNRMGYHGFTSNNFWLARSLFLQVQFNERIRGYGHEDTLFGFALREQGIPIRYLDNPLQHIGLETASIFLEKTKEGVYNLKRLYREGYPIDTHLLRVYLNLKKWKLCRIIAFCGNWFLPAIENQLQSKHPRLLLLDLYKLILICATEPSHTPSKPL